MSVAPAIDTTYAAESDLWWEALEDSGQSKTMQSEQAPLAERVSRYRQIGRPSRGFFREKTERSLHTYNEEQSGGLGNKNATIEVPRVSTSGRFLVLRRWEGYVVNVNDDSFIARLIDPEHKRADEEAEFAFTEIPDFDRELVATGAVFYWTVGFADSAAGSRTRASTIRFRRLPVWSNSELELAKSNAEQLLKVFD